MPREKPDRLSQRRTARWESPAGRPAGRARRKAACSTRWLSQPILIVLIVQALGGIRIFDIIYLLTGGGPGYQTTTLGFAAYVTSFISTDIGRGNAWSYTVAILTLVIAIFYMKLLYGRGDVRS